MHSRSVSELSERSAMTNEMQGRTPGFALILNSWFLDSSDIFIANVVFPLFSCVFLFV